MDDPQIAAKREEAAKAMSSGFSSQVTPPIPVLPVQTSPATITDIVKPAPQSKDSMSIAEKRLQAQIAMEGEERRKAREEQIRKEKEAIEKKRQNEELAKKQQYEKERIAREQAEQAERIRQQREQISKQIKQQVEEVKESGAGLKTIRTLKFDQDSLIKNQNISLVGIAIKEEERRRQRQENNSLSSGKNIKLFVASAVLVLLGLGVGLYVYYFYYQSLPIGVLPGNKPAAQSILFTENYKALDVTSITTDDLFNRIKNEIRNPPDLRLGAIENFAFTTRGANNLSANLTTADFFKIILSNPPDSLLRTLSSDYMYGVLSSAENAAFIVLKAEAYDKGLAGLLEWEGTTLTKDLYTPLTSLKPDPELLTKPFEDLLIRNVDTRILKDKDGNIRIVYGFIDGEKTIVIAGSKQAFIEALNRFNTPRPLSQ